MKKHIFSREIIGGYYNSVPEVKRTNVKINALLKTERSQSDLKKTKFFNFQNFAYFFPRQQIITLNG